MKQTRIYPLARGGGARRTTSSSTSPTQVFNTVHANDFSFFEEVDELVAGGAGRGARRRAGRPARGDRASSTGQPFAPDDRMRAHPRAGGRRSAPAWPAPSPMRRAIRKPCCTGRGRTRSSAAATSSCATAPGCSMPAPSSTTSPPSSPRRWRTPRSVPDRPTPTRSTTATATCSTAARTYRLHVDPDPPAKNFWAVDLYDTQTRSLLQVPSTIWPALASNTGTLQANDDGSYDLYFGPTAPEGKRVELGRDHPRQVVVPALPASTARSSPGSTRPGGSTSSSRSTEPDGLHVQDPVR